MKIYTKTGDLGETSLFGGERVPKSSLRIEAYGTVDELNSIIGMAKEEVAGEGVKELLSGIQNKLFNLGADLATPETEKNKKLNVPRITETDVTEAEKAIDYYSDKLPELRVFVLPGGNKASALMHIARTVCRRAERGVVSLNMAEEINKNILILLNRYSDLFFVLARFENLTAGNGDVAWQK